MNIKELDLLIAKLEGGKKQVDIAQIKEIRKILCRLFAEPGGLAIIDMMVKNGKQQLWRSSKK